MKLRQILFRNNFTRPLVLLFAFVVFYVILKSYVLAPLPNSLSYTNNNFYVFDLNIPADL